MTAELLDEIERRARNDKRARSRQLKGGSAELEETAPSPVEPVAFKLAEGTVPISIDDIDWSSARYDIVTVKDLRP